MRYLIFGIITFVVINRSLAQEIKISEDLTLFQLSEHCFVHTQGINNGLVYINDGEAIVVSTPETDTETQNLIDWIRNKKHAKIVAYIIDRWHPDAMGGINTVHKNGIKTVANKRTKQIAKEKRLPLPQNIFSSKKEIKVGSEKVICHFLGEAHTPDGIVVWVPKEQILFGGNEIRNYNGWVGNIGDANLEDWATTATRIKKEYGSAKFVIPGHGKYGGSELIDYTIDLFTFPENSSAKKNDTTTLPPEIKTTGNVYIQAESDSLQNGKRILTNAIVIVQDSSKYVEIESPKIIFQTDNNRIDSESGRVKIFDKAGNGKKIRTDVDYKKLMVYKINDNVGLVVVLKEITQNNR